MSEPTGGGLPEKGSVEGADTSVGIHDITFSSLNSRPLERVSIPEQQERNARYVAGMLLWIFAGSMLGTFLLLVSLVMLAFYHPTMVLTAIIPALDNFTRFFQLVGTIFSPLLAFILGFYFSNSRRHPSPKDDN